MSLNNNQKSTVQNNIAALNGFCSSIEPKVDVDEVPKVYFLYLLGKRYFIDPVDLELIEIESFAKFMRDFSIFKVSGTSASGREAIITKVPYNKDIDKSLLNIKEFNMNLGGIRTLEKWIGELHKKSCDLIHVFNIDHERLH